MKLRTLLILAVMNQHLLVVKYLIEQGADPTHKDKFSKTARDYAEESLKNSKSKHEQVIAKNIASLFSWFIIIYSSLRKIAHKIKKQTFTTLIIINVIR